MSFFIYIQINRLIPVPNDETLKITAPTGINLTNTPSFPFSVLGAPPKNPPEIRRGAIKSPARSSQTAQSSNLE
jgi:hypothetical protein